MSNLNSFSENITLIYISKGGPFCPILGRNAAPLWGQMAHPHKSYKSICCQKMYIHRVIVSSLYIYVYNILHIKLSYKKSKLGKHTFWLFEI